MKIQKVKSRAYKGKNYYKYRIEVPEVVIRSAGLKECDELDVKTQKEKLFLEKVRD